MNTFRILFVLFFILGSLLGTSPLLLSQTVPEHISHSTLYDFLDELANEKLIALSSVCKPYSRKMILDKLTEAEKNLAAESSAPGVGKVAFLSKRQTRELSFFLREFRLEEGINHKQKGDVDLYRKDSSLSISLTPPGLAFSDGFFRFAFRPVTGLRYFRNEKGDMTHRWQGAEAWGYVGDHWGFYANLRDNYQSRQLTGTRYFTQETGALYKGEKGLTDFAEMRAGLTYSWRWGSIGLEKENLVWGTNYHGSNILSGHPPSFVLVDLHVYPVRWLDFNYFHGWLVSEVLDSQRTYQHAFGTRKIFRDKYIAANMLTVTPWKYLNISVGNSVIYSDNGVQPLYFIPFLFFKAVDYSTFANSNEAGQNAQMFFDISSRNLRHLHIFTSFYIDEISFSRFWDKQKHSNFISGKVGARLSNYPFKDISLTAEYTRTNPLVYQHFIETTTFASNRYSLGHYLRDNSEEVFFSASFKPLRGVALLVSYTDARHGNDYVYGKDPSHGLPFMQTVTWEQQVWDMTLSYELVARGMLFFHYQVSDICGNAEIYTPEFFRGKTSTLEAGLNLGI